MLLQSTLPPDLRTANADQLAVMSAFAVGGTYRPRTWVYTLLGEIGARTSEGKRFTGERVREVLHELDDAGWIEEHRQRQGFWRLLPALDNQVLGLLLDRPDRDTLLAALRRVERVDSPQIGSMQFHTQEGAIAVLRLELFAGRSLAQVAPWRNACRWSANWEQVLNAALASAVRPELLRRLDGPLLNEVIASRLVHVLVTWQPDPLPLVELARERLAIEHSTGQDLRLRMVFAEYLLCSGHGGEVDAVVRPLREAQSGEDAEYRRALAAAVEAALHAAHGRWSDAETGYDAALAQLRKQTGQRKGVLPEQLLMPCVQSLLAQQSPPKLEKALKLCLAEAGQRRPTDDSSWGVVALALQMRSGETPRDDDAFRPHSTERDISLVDLSKWLMRAWLKDDAAAEPLPAEEQQAADALLSCLQAAGLHGLRAQCEDALNVLAARPVRPTFFVPAAAESWRVALSALAAIAGPVQTQTGRESGSEVRIVWVLSLGDDGSVKAIVPTEQKRGVRGWGRPQPISLAKLSRSASLAPHDAQVARSIKQSSPYAGAREMVIDAAAAVVALIGHPAVELAGNPGVAVTLVEGTPQIEVVDDGDSLRMTVHPPLRSAPSAPWGASANEQKAAESLAAITVLREGPQRARVVRFTPAQRRAAQLLDKGLAVPKSAAAQLQAVLEALGAHFQVSSDIAPSARDVAADSRLRAELTPLGDGLRLRLVVAPFGADGPRTVPGHGRPRLIAAVRGETLAVQRDLVAERQHLAQVLEAVPLLGTPVGGEAEFEVPGAEDALVLVEALPRLPAVQAIDWPAGRAVNVTPVGLRQLQVQVHSRHDWLALAGGVRVDESLVFGIEQLLQWSAGARGRFVPLGEGRYLALTQELRARVADLAAVAELQRGEVKVAGLAAGWLDATLDGAEWQADAALRRRIDRLVHARELQPALPSTLQAELRPYQLDGYQWAMRLAAADCGACLADDMGLGKTLQALAVLLDRAAGGAALVVAPTSLIGNWQSEARRFTPALKIHVFGGGDDREALVANAGAHDVLLVSYGLLQLNAEAFAGREWHTLVLDEAQQLKNAAAKRTQAAQELRAPFRLALSGTPVENRLAELWSIMRICNPGLLGPLARFNERFATPIERDRDRDAQRTLRRLIAPFVLRRTKAQVLDDLPPRTELTITVQPEPAERAHYEALRRQAVAAAERSLAEGGAQAQINILAQLTRLRRAACDPRLVSPQMGIAGAKVQAFTELVAELVANGHKALVFSQFVDFLALLRQPLDEAGIVYHYLDGATPAAERTRRVAAFQAGEGALFLISLKAGGFGLNLTVADYVVIADPWWNPAAEDQASGRAHRIGQQRPVTVYRLVSAGTLEERIVELHQHKRELADGVLEGVEAGATLDAQALMQLIRGERSGG
jgi:superfamily II DNA or RNA helicase